MSTDDEGKEVSVCANCGKGEEESGNLKSCTACKSVKYCSRDCQIAHRPQHKKECRRRAAELHDEKLFKQPPPEEDCPICFVLLPLLQSGSKYQTCCGKVVCSGCIHAPLYDNQGKEVDNQKCPFCRTLTPKSTEAIERLPKRVEADDPIAMGTLGSYYGYGMKGYPRDHAKAIDLWHQAGELGLAKSYTNIGIAYDRGHGVEVDKKKANYYLELAAMGGDTAARHNLGSIEARAGNIDRALKHFMIAVRGGHAYSLDAIKSLYMDGHAAKEDYTKALQSYQVYLSEIKSDQRDRAAAYSDRYRYY